MLISTAISSILLSVFLLCQFFAFQIHDVEIGSSSARSMDARGSHSIAQRPSSESILLKTTVNSQASLLHQANFLDDPQADDEPAGQVATQRYFDFYHSDSRQSIRQIECGHGQLAPPAPLWLIHQSFLI